MVARPVPKITRLACNLGRVHVVGRVDIANVIGREVEFGQMEWRVYRILNIDDISLVDSETVDLERVGGLERVLPALLLSTGLGRSFPTPTGSDRCEPSGCERSTSATTRRERSSFHSMWKRIIGTSATAGCGCAC